MQMLLFAAVLALPLLTGVMPVGNRFVFTPKPGNPGTPARHGLPGEAVRLVTTDGVTLSAWFIPGAPKKPLLVYFHGNASNLADCVGYLRLFHELGFPLLAVDYRGYGASSGKLEREEELYRDGRGVITYLEKRGWRPDGMIFYGQSLGGAVALQMARETPPAGLVLEATFTSIPDMARLMSPFWYPVLGRWLTEARFDNLAKIPSLKVPLLLLQADRDPVVPAAMAQRLLTAATTPKSLHLYRGNTHCDAVREDRAGLAAALITFAADVTPSRKR
jgi:pimeloyl-ACP methyl ester carboxylesterase